MNSEDLLNAKLEELKKWRDNDVYEQITFQRESCITLRWVNTYKMINGQKKIKSRLVARGLEQNQEILWTDSPTCAKETLSILLIVIASNKWKCQAIDVKTVFLESKPIEKEVYVILPQGANEKDNLIWKLKCVYGLGDASRNWYLSIKEKLEELKVKCCKSDPALFVYHENNKLQGIIC